MANAASTVKVNSLPGNHIGLTVTGNVCQTVAQRAIHAANWAQHKRPQANLVTPYLGASSYQTMHGTQYIAANLPLVFKVRIAGKRYTVAHYGYQSGFAVVHGQSKAAVQQAIALGLSVSNVWCAACNTFTQAGQCPHTMPQ